MSVRYDYVKHIVVFVVVICYSEEYWCAICMAQTLTYYPVGNGLSSGQICRLSGGILSAQTTLTSMLRSVSLREIFYKTLELSFDDCKVKKINNC